MKKKQNKSFWKKHKISIARMKLEIEFAFFLILFLVILGMDMLTIAEAVQKPAWVEIYSYPMFSLLNSNDTNQTITACNINGCSNVDIGYISHAWHYFLFGQVEDIYAIAILSFFCALCFIFMLWSLEERIEFEFEHKRRR